MAESSREFGANEWLVDEMYEQYQRDPNSVDKVWWDFFANKSPGGANGAKDTGANGQTKPATEPAKAGSPAQQETP